MRQPKIFNVPASNHLPDMRLALRKDFYELFDANLKDIKKETGAVYFGHNIIKNYQEADHRVSTFCNYEDWHDLYWAGLCCEDPLEKVIHRVVGTNDFGVMSWELGHNGSKCSQERERITHIKDGIMFSFRRPGNYFETISLGWENVAPDELDTEYIAHLSSLLRPMRDHHWDVHDKI